jgi:hypothetical protein
MRHADLLGRLRIVSPCYVPWADMTGDDRVRSCDRCRKNVYNVAAMTRAEVVAMIRGAGESACLRLTRRPDGTIVTAGCWARLRQARRRGLLAFAVVLPVVLAAQLWTQAFGLRALVSLLRGKPAPFALAPAVSWRGRTRVAREGHVNDELTWLGLGLGSDVGMGAVGWAAWMGESGALRPAPVDRPVEGGSLPAPRHRRQPHPTVDR